MCLPASLLYFCLRLPELRIAYTGSSGASGNAFKPLAAIPKEGALVPPVPAGGPLPELPAPAPETRAVPAPLPEGPSPGPVPESAPAPAPGLGAAAAASG